MNKPKKSQEISETVELNLPQQKRGCRRGCMIFLIIFVIVAIPVWRFCLHTTPLRISKETTYVTEPMTADGKRIDYFRAMEERYYPPEMKTDDNGYRMIVRACGDLTKRYKTVTDPKTGETKSEELISESLRIQVYEKLGLDPNTKPTLKIESPDKILLQYQSNHPNDKTVTDLFNRYSQQHVSWTFDDFPILKDWLTENNAGIDLLGEAVRKPEFRIPLVWENENSPIQAVLPIDETMVVREFARAAVGRAKYRIGIGDIDGAIDDVITVHRLGCHTRKQGTIVVGLIGMAIERMAFSVHIGANPDHPLTKKQLERWIKELDNLPPRVTINECLESERFFCLASLQDMYWGKMSFDNDDEVLRPIKLYPYSRWFYDFNIIFIRFNKLFDLVIDGTFDETTDCNSSINLFRYLTVRSRSEQFCNTFASLTTPSLQSTREAWRRCECTENMQRLTLALLLYEKDYGKIPDNNWQTAIRSYLGDHAEHYFRCPTSGLAEGETSYLLVNDGSDKLLIETKPSDPHSAGSFHHWGYNTGYRSGAVRFEINRIENSESK
jgi:hypothetical protein